MLGALTGVQIELEAQLAELIRNSGEPSLAAQCSTQLGALNALQSSISSAKHGTLQAMRADVAATIATAQMVTQQVRLATAAASAADATQSVTTGAAVRREVAALNDDLFTKRIFDPYLKFSSREDEEAYRRREGEARSYIERQLAAKTPEGELNAAGATMGQMLDAHAHGAGDSPEFAARWNRLVDTTRNHREALRREGHSTEEFDRNLANSVRRYLRSKGLSDAEIDAKLSATADPLDAVKPFLKTDQDAKALGESVTAVERVLSKTETAVTVAVPFSPQDIDRNTVGPSSAVAPGVADVMATFRAAGVVAAPMSPAEGFAHGVNAAAGESVPEGRATPR